MFNLRQLVKSIKGNDCEKFVKTIGNEYSLSGGGIDGGPVKINIGMFANKVIESFINQPTQLVSLDNSQYLLCKEISETNDQDLKLTYKELEYR